ncbi:MAG: Rne/Rng family ribonuclease [Opitutales bacterium]|jgi:ribonuclease G|nr:Rne/Rng family ribonuclease [Opitutales bacterium]MDP4659439.1 Rne/Rng family ribonuclease [Opitutales bacterium]MDP4776024.1 Rne/Rng family ribonuclease [Opitutales bacterium]MDP4787902.1 Rne/Rng family ribonuclease [Opitutales bacterium]MDP4861546.1 Rne/Rng family ribonuclease [Opitutales bacterium]
MPANTEPEDINDELPEEGGEQTSPIDQRKLADEAAKRRKELPLLQRIVKHFSKDRAVYRELVINAETLEKRVALLTNGVLDKFEIEHKGENRMVGAIFKGRVQNLEGGLKAAFVDIGQPKNAFLHYWDMLPAANDSQVEFIRDNESAEQKQRKARYQAKDIPQLFPAGSDIVIQVVKDQIGTKGPRSTTNIALPGRYLVLMPFSGACGVSRKIEESAERERLKDILRSLTIPEGMGVIIRTAGEGKQARWFVRDLHMLLKRWQAIVEKINAPDRRPVLLYQEPGLIERTVRDFLTEEVDRILVDNPEDFKVVQDLVGEVSPRSRSRVELYADPIPVFERYNIERQIEQLFQRRVPLPSGGEIVIDETEALTAIDVNTGGHRGKDGAKDGNFITQANLEAVTEAARQIKLRNLGGLIMIDTIDMKNPKDRKKVFEALREAMEDDRAKHQILPISALGVLQMTRQRHTESNTTSMYTACPHCQGRGIVKNPRTVSVEIQRKLLSVIRRLREAAGPEKELEINILLHPVNLERIITEDREFFRDLMKSCKVRLGTKPDPTYSIEAFKLFDGAGMELR